jgi:chromosome segregation ATPase
VSKLTDGTITDEVRIKELQDALRTETDRLQKLFAAYETQEKELVDARAEIEVLEKEIIDREIEKESLESIIAEKDVRLRELERKATTSMKRVEHLEPELEKMEEKYTREKDRLGKVFSIAEELDNDLRLAVAEMSARDTWYMDHMALFEELNKAIKVRYDMIERAVEAERKSQHLRRAFTERVDELVEARASELSVEDEQSEDVEEEAPPIEESSSPEATIEDAGDDDASVDEEPDSTPSDKEETTWSDAEDPWSSS